MKRKRMLAFLLTIVVVFQDVVPVFASALPEEGIQVEVPEAEEPLPEEEIQAEMPEAEEVLPEEEIQAEVPEAEEILPEVNQEEDEPTIESIYGESAPLKSYLSGNEPEDVQIQPFAGHEWPGSFGEQIIDHMTARELYDSMVESYVTGTETQEVTIVLKNPITFEASITFTENEDGTRTGIIDQDEKLENAVCQLLEGFDMAFPAFVRDYPEVFWIAGMNMAYRIDASGSESEGFTGTISRITLSVSKYYDGENPRVEEYQKAVDSIKAELEREIGPDASRYVIVKEIHDYLCETLEYNYEAVNSDNEDSHLYAHTSSTAFLGRESDGLKSVVCEGYAKAMKVLCEQWGIPCVLVTGSGVTQSGAEAHMWNYVQMEDEKWYAVDTTWDDQTSGICYDYFLAGYDSQGFYTVFGQDHLPAEVTAGADTSENIFRFVYPVLEEGTYTPAEDIDVNNILTAYEKGLLQIDYAVKYSYTGNMIVPTPYSVIWEDEELIQDRDYRVVYTDRDGNPVSYIRDEGLYCIVLEGIYDYTGSIALDIQVTEEYDLNDMTVSAIASQVYTGTAICPTVKITNPRTKAVLREGVHYTLSWKDNVDAGTASIIINAVDGKGYIGRREVFFTISRCAISDNKVVLSGIDSSYRYTGQKICPVFVLKKGDYCLEEGKDYTVSYRSNINTGTAAVKITGLGNYFGTREMTFRILPAILSAPDVKLSFSDVLGARPSVMVSFNGTVLTAGKDYTVSYTSYLMPGRGQVIITGKGNYTGTVKRTYQVPAIEIKKEHISFPEMWYYTGLHVSAAPSQIVIGGRKLVRGVDYVITYENTAGEAVLSVSKADDYVLVVTGKGNYAGTVRLPFTITTDYLLGKMCVSNIEPQTYTGTEIKPEITVTNPYENSQVLVENRDYTVEYFKNTESGTASMILKAVNGSGYAGQRTVAFTIQRCSVDDDKITVEIGKRYAYGGVPCEPVPVVKLNSMVLIEGKDYTLQYFNNDSANVMARMTISGIGNFTGTRNVPFEIVEEPFSADIVCTLEEGEVFTYTGEAIEPSLTVTAVNGDSQEEQVLQEGVHYRVRYTNNVEAGTGLITIYGIEEGGYTGMALQEFFILPKNLNSDEIQVSFKGSIQTASGQIPKLTVTDGEYPLTEGIDYQMDCVVEESVVRVTLTGLGNYEGIRTENFDRILLSSENIRAELAYWEKAYTGYRLEPKVSVWADEILLKENQDYIVTYRDNKNAGTAVVSIQGVGIYGGVLERTFRILPVDINTLSVEALSDCAYWEAVDIDTIIKYNNLTLKKYRDYTIDFTEGVHSGVNKVKIEGIGNYTGARYQNLKVTFTSKDYVKIISCSAVDYSVEEKALTVQVRASYNELLANSPNPVYLAQMDSLGKTIIGTVEGIVSSDSDMIVSAKFMLNSEDEMVECQEIHNKMQPYFRSAMMSKYALAVKSENGYQLISTNPMYIENPEITAVMDNTYMGYYEGKVASKKGIQDAHDSYTADLGVSHVLLNVYLDDLISTTQKTGYEAYTYKGVTYYFSDLIGLSNTIYSLNGWDTVYGKEQAHRNVTLVLLLRWKDSLSYLIHPSARVRGAAPYYALNMKEKRARETFEALFCYMGVKLGNNKKYRVCNWTLGNEVNCCQAWNYSGGLSIQECAKNYAEAFQLLYQGVRRTASTDRVFISLDHSWEAANSGHKGKDFLDCFAAYMNNTAPRMEWNVNYHPYSNPLNKNDFWNDYSSTTNSSFSPYISMRNISVLTNYLGTLEKKYGKESGSIRVILGEQGFSAVRGSGNEASQAAALAYGFYIAAFNSRIDAFIIRAYLDDSAETKAGLYLGLRDRSHNPKQSYAMYKNVDTIQSLDYTNKYLSVIGAKNWKGLIPAFDVNKLRVEGL